MAHPMNTEPSSPDAVPPPEPPVGDELDGDEPDEINARLLVIV